MKFRTCATSLLALTALAACAGPAQAESWTATQNNFTGTGIGVNLISGMKYYVSLTLNWSGYWNSFFFPRKPLDVWVTLSELKFSSLPGGGFTYTPFNLVFQNGFSVYPENGVSGQKTAYFSFLYTGPSVSNGVNGEVVQFGTGASYHWCQVPGLYLCGSESGTATLSTTPLLPVPGPEAGTGLVSALGLGALALAHVRRRAQRPA